MYVLLSVGWGHDPKKSPSINIISADSKIRPTIAAIATNIPYKSPKKISINIGEIQIKINVEIMMENTLNTRDFEII
ncbi:hypothetical protein C5S42_00230 [Candidatus Methanomarinus sp.]|nr:hypothetical protein C5S42_00230 [ANME-2 cluster archaeon]